MGKKQFIVVSNVHMGKTPYTLVSGTPIATAKWNTLDKGIVFEAEEGDMAKLLAAGAIKPFTGENEPEPVAAPVEKKGKR